MLHFEVHPKQQKKNDNKTELFRKQQPCQQTKPKIVWSDHIYWPSKHKNISHRFATISRDSKFIHVLNDHFIFNRRRCHLALFYSPPLDHAPSLFRSFLSFSRARSCDCMRVCVGICECVWSTYMIVCVFEGRTAQNPAFALFVSILNRLFHLQIFASNMNKKNSSWMLRMSTIWL